MQLANRLNRVAEPQTIRMAKLSRELKAQGIDIIDLSLGEPDFATPAHICDAATQAMKDGYTKYPPVAGIPDLRAAISKKLLRDNGLEYAPEEIIVSTGAKQSLANAVLSIINQSFTHRQRWFWILTIVCLPGVGLLCYLPFSLGKDRPGKLYRGERRK